MRYFVLSWLVLCLSTTAFAFDQRLFDKLDSVSKSKVVEKHYHVKKAAEPEVYTEPAPEVAPALAVYSEPVTLARQGFEPEMVAITGGCFQMGSPTSEPEHLGRERQHQVCVDDFYIGKYEITQAQWQAVMGNNPSHFKQCGDNCPVENVSWDDVQTFIEKLNAKTGKTYRLPTEAQWEYAARAGTTTPFYTGNCINTSQANYNGNYDYNNCEAKTGVYKKQTVAVGSYYANQFGLYDMAGNVWEWVCSEYKRDYDGSEKECASKDSTVPPVLRGGSWEDFSIWLRSAYRYSYTPSYRGNFLGFRLSTVYGAIRKIP